MPPPDVLQFGENNHEGQPPILGSNCSSYCRIGRPASRRTDSGPRVAVTTFPACSRHPETGATVFGISGRVAGLTKLNVTMTEALPTRTEPRVGQKSWNPRRPEDCWKASSLWRQGPWQRSRKNSGEQEQRFPSCPLPSARIRGVTFSEFRCRLAR
jgi:hypothetical protein